MDPMDMLWSGAGFTEPDLIEIKDIFSPFDITNIRYKYVIF